MIEETHTLKCHYKGVQPFVKVTAYELSAIDCSADRMSGYYGETATLTANAAPAGYNFSGWNITGSQITGNSFIFQGDVIAKAGYSAIPVVYNLTLQTDGNGQIYSDKNTGYSNDTVTLSNTPSAGYLLNRYDITGATLTGSQFKFENQDVTAKAIFTATGYTLTLQNDGHGTISANKVTGFAGDTVTLSTSYNTYYRFNNYSVTGGTINGNTFTFGNGNATAKANFKTNNFTATGKFETGSDVSVQTKGGTATKVVPEKYAIHGAHTGNVPTAWYNTSNRWKPSNVSGYSITLNTKMTFSGRSRWQDTRGGIAYATGTTMIGTTATNTKTYYQSDPGSAIWNYNQTVTTTAQNVNYGISGNLYVQASYGQGNYGSAYAGYIATGTTGTWTATGIAP